jgi:hypothetical protein
MGLYDDIVDGLEVVVDGINECLDPYVVHDGGFIENFAAGAANAACMMGMMGHAASLGTCAASQALIRGGLALGEIAYANRVYAPIPKGKTIGEYARYDARDREDPTVIYNNGRPYVRKDLIG